MFLRKNCKNQQFGAIVVLIQGHAKVVRLLRLSVQASDTVTPLPYRRQVDLTSHISSLVLFPQPLGENSNYQRHKIWRLLSFNRAAANAVYAGAKRLAVFRKVCKITQSELQSDSVHPYTRIKLP